MTPTMLFTPDGKTFAAYGSPGGASIINSVINVTMNLIDHKMGLQEAIDAGRISVTSALASTRADRGAPASGVHRRTWPRWVTRVSGGDIGSVQAVLIDQQTGKQYGAADDRREGTVIGLPRTGGK